jgi:GNAT superfamily N-acetyltransferase
VTAADILIEAKLHEESGYRFHDDVHGFHHGQTDGTIHALAPGQGYDDKSGSWKSAGQLHYTVFRGRTNIRNLDVHPDHQRKGVASGLYAELLKGRQHHEIDWGYTTPDGTAFKTAMDAKHGGYIRAARIERGLAKARQRTAR